MRERFGVDDVTSGHPEAARGEEKEKEEKEEDVKLRDAPDCPPAPKLKRKPSEKSKKQYQYILPKGVADLDCLLEPNVERADWLLHTLLQLMVHGEVGPHQLAFDRAHVSRFAACLNTRNLIVIERVSRIITKLLSVRLACLRRADQADDEEAMHVSRKEACALLS